MSDDPFSPEADPYAPDPKVARRELAKLVALPLLAAPVLQACAHLPLGCPPKAEDERSCQHRFCRYHRPG